MAVGAGAVGIMSGSASAAFMATFTADNHYAIYGRDGDTFTLAGGNELGAGGSPGQYNWSKPETHSVGNPDYVYIAAWSDDNVAQGLIGQIDVDGMKLYTNDDGWQVYATGIDLDDGAPYPTAMDIAAHVAFADLNNLWLDPYVGGQNNNGTSPWGAVPDIDEEARWIWANAPQGQNALVGGKNWDEYLIFRRAVPTPGTASLLVIALGACHSRRRES